MSSPLPDYYRSLMEIQPSFSLHPDPTRRLPAVLEHLIKPDRLKAITQEISRLGSKALEDRLKLLDVCFEGIVDLEERLIEVFDRYYGPESPLSGCSRTVKIIAAAAISQAFPYEGLACFNPAITIDPGRPALDDGTMPVLMTLRSYGEYHRSSISFRTGAIDKGGDLCLDEPERTKTGAALTRLPRIEGTGFVFPPDANPNSMVLYAPYLMDVGETWEDVRFTRIKDEGEYGDAFFGTFTSFNILKRRLQSGVLVTRDFRSFNYQVLRGSCVEDKDLAYFPRRIKGRFAMLSRNDGRDLFLMTSDDPFSWSRKKKIAECRPDSFDAHKMGVCAPPIETSLGWLVIYHGVSDPGQIYSISAMLLDLEDPSVVKARLPYTLHHPLSQPEERMGMLTTINYTCGALVHESSGSLVMPYACNDTFCRVGRMGLDELLARLMDDGAR